ncbi:MAG: GAF domain-containing sensor histidine kinase [Actinomycetia bacterium]|nr:GAF domain-containing sensor histidine kinase [Actinomycetes bacterium]
MTDLLAGDETNESQTRSGHKTQLAAGPPTVAAAASSSHPLDAGPMADRLPQFGPAILAVRWATTGVSVILAGPDLLESDLWVATWVAIVLTNTVVRTFRPLHDNGSLRHMIILLAEIGLHVMAVIATGYWGSPVVLVLFNAVIIAGFARGFGFALRVGSASALAVTVPGLGDGWGADELARSAQWTTLLVLGGIVAGYTRRISGEASRRHDLALDRVSRLADANALLTDLHRVAQTLPASLDQAEVLESTMSRLDGLVDFDTFAILLSEAGSNRLTVARRLGANLGNVVSRDQLPLPAVQAMSLHRLETTNGLAPGDRPLSPRSTAGMYIPLLARGRLVGLLAVETASKEGYKQRDQQLMKGFVEPVALAIDNARWFDRIRTVGADEERTRIARDLHDRVGQALAYFGFEIDRLVRCEAAGEPMGAHLKALRENLRSVVVEVRDTLSDLRTDVTDNKDFAATAEQFATRLAERSGLTIDLDCDTRARLPILQEREIWRIAQEALVNIERHAKATAATLIWRCDGRGAVLEVTDDGRGLPKQDSAGHIGRPDSYGIIGMRERADSIGATFEMISNPGEGTRIQCFLAKK